MDKKTLTELDFYRIREEIAGFCVSEEGRDTFLRIEPFSDEKIIEERKNLSREWLVLLNTTRSAVLSGWPRVFPVIKAVGVSGSCITVEQAYWLLQFCNSIFKVKSGLESGEKELGLTGLCELCRSMPDITECAAQIGRIIAPDGTLRDLPEIRAIRERISNLNNKIRQIMHKFTSDAKYGDILESTVPVLRGGRQVLAVKTSRRNSIPGIIHEMSGTGQTSYIEPEEAVLCSNELIQAEFELDLETRRIMMKLAASLLPFSHDFILCLKVMEKLDCTYAAAAWGKAKDCVFALPCDNEPLWLNKARHPLLGDKAVPIDVHFMDGKRILIITGPNTGGKTVTLKTIALFSMLNQAGFPVPAAEGTRLPIFTGVFADIGDEQSMDESLSTFSGHMKNIARAVRNVNQDSLVLLDELGSGTDPQEGAAISMAVLDHLIEKKAFVLITTHQGVIKNYGYTHPECINASVEFNSDTLSPTYRLLMGVPGESHALDIAKRSGLPSFIVSKAKEYIVSEKADVSSLIRGLTKKHSELDEISIKIQEEENRLFEKMQEIEVRSVALKEKEHELKMGIQRESQEFLSESRKKLENLVRILKEGEVTREKTLGVKQFLSDLSQSVESQEKILEAEEVAIAIEKERVSKIRVSHKKTKKKLKLSDALAQAQSYGTNGLNDAGANALSKGELRLPLVFEKGANVLAGSGKRAGVIVGAAGKGKWSVQVGSITMVMKQSDLELVSKNEADNGISYAAASYTVDMQLSSSGHRERPAFELRLMGMRVEEAMRELEHQIDLCLLHDFKEFSIIHGKGNGVLQQFVQDYLSNCSVVRDFRFAMPEDGGTGKTYVSLR